MFATNFNFEMCEAMSEDWQDFQDAVAAELEAEAELLEWHEARNAEAIEMQEAEFCRMGTC